MVRSVLRLSVISLLLSVASFTTAQDQLLDRQALTLVSQSVAVMGGAVPSDSTATGTITITAGSTSETGTIRLVTRGIDQSAEEITTSKNSRTVTYSQGRASEKENDESTRLWMELTVTAQSPDFPLALLAGALGRADSGFAFVADEETDGRATSHVRFWQDFGDDPQIKHLSEFSIRDVWIDMKTGLPLKLVYKRRPNDVDDYLLIEVFYSDYRNVNGVLYPHTIKKKLNGTDWQTIKIQSVTFNTGLSETEFSLK